MPGLTIHRLTDPFLLPDTLAAALAAPTADPLAPVQVVLPGPGWRGWLARTLTDRLGVLAGVELLEVGGFRRQWPSPAVPTPARILAIHAALPAAAADDAELRAWLARDPDGSWRMNLAQQLAEALAEDLLLRPARDTAAVTPALIAAQAAALAAPPEATPLREADLAGLHWVASAALLAHDWALLSGLAATRPVTVWVLAPGAEDHHDPLLALLDPEAPRIPAPLSAALRPVPTPIGPPSPAGALAGLRAAWAGGPPLTTLPPGALTVAAAPELWRQLHQIEAWLASRFAADPTLSPADVLLLSPALPAAAPLVDAVFGAATGPAWPYRISGRRDPRPAATLLQQLLDSPRARWTPDELLDLLRTPAIAAGLGLDAEAPERLAATLVDAGVGWGLDAGSRRDHQAGADASHSWTAQWPLIAGALAPDDPLQQLPGVFAALIAYREASRGTQPGSAQTAALQQLLDALLPAPRRHPAADAVWRCWQALRADLADLPDPPLTQAAYAALLAPRAVWQAEPAEPPPATAAPEAGLQVAPLRPGAIRPARLIALFGLDALNFPRRPDAGLLAGWRAALDAAHPALAPADAGEADRLLLLESLWMAADATLWLYADRDAASGQPLPAPALIDAALAYLPGADRTRPTAGVDPPGSATGADTAGARIDADSPASDPPAHTDPAPAAGRIHPAPTPPPSAPACVQLPAFCTCFREPARFHWVDVRGMAPPPAPLPVDGPLALDALTAWQLRTRILQRLDEAGPAALPEAPDAAALARLPPGVHGLQHWATLRAEALALWHYHHDLLLDGGDAQTLALDLAVDDTLPQLRGSLRVHAGQLIERVAGPPHARQLVHAWVRGLALAAMEVPKADLVLVGWSPRGPMHLVLRLPAPALAQARLAELLGWYARAWQEPLPFTPGLGLALAEGGLRAAHWHWAGTAQAPGEAQEPLQRLVWAGADPTAPAHAEDLAALTRLLLPAALIKAWRSHWT